MCTGWEQDRREKVDGDVKPFLWAKQIETNPRYRLKSLNIFWIMYHAIFGWGGPPFPKPPRTWHEFCVPPLDVTLRRFFACHVASCRFTSLFFAFFFVVVRFFTIFWGFGSQNGWFLRSFFDKIWLLDEKIDFAKNMLPSRRNAYF